MSRIPQPFREKTIDPCKFQFPTANLTKEGVCQGDISSKVFRLLSCGQFDPLIRNHRNQDTVPDISELS